MATTPADYSSPGRRKRNPLGDFSSYTYHLTLYMIAPDAYNEFIKSGRKNINAQTPGAYIIAQSGGTPNPEPPAPSPRAAGFELDYYIDNLKISTTMPASKPMTTAMSFDITEPYGFSFMSRLYAAQTKMMADSKTPGFTNMTSVPNPTRQFFILSVGFKGYDSNGKVMTNADIASQNALSTEVSGLVYDHFYEIYMTKMTFKLDGKATIYHITASTVTPTTAFALKQGMVNIDAKVIAGTLNEAVGGSNQSLGSVQGLLTLLNKNQNDLVNPKADTVNPELTKPSLTRANVYNIEWQGDTEEITAFKDSLMTSPADKDKNKQPMASVKNIAASNEATAEKSAPDITRRIIQFRRDTSIIAAMESLIKQSSYVEDTLKVIQVSQEEAVPNDSSPEAVAGGTKTLKWYSLGARIEILGWDDLIKDYTYKVTYIIRPYSIPAIGSPFVSTQANYYGAYKRYDYYFTGQNSEVLRIDQSFDNAFLNVMYQGAASSDSAGVPNSPDQSTDASTQGRKGQSFSAANSIVTQLRDPVAFSKTKLQILGDPDYLIHDSPSSLGELTKGGYYAADGFTINASTGQVFIEVAYKEAVDYQNSTGLMKINSNIEFFPYPKVIQDLLGGAMCYLLVGVVSTFSRGSFTQELTTAINSFPDYKPTVKK